MTAAGPFTTTDSMTYQPLYDFLVQVAEFKPDIVFLIGPFVDAKHPDVTNFTLKRTFMDVFERMLVRISEMTQECGAKVILVPCAQRDVHHDPIYPCPPFVAKRAAKRIHENMYLQSDPCMLRVGGVVFGVSGADVLFHLGSEEISINRNPEGSDRMKRLLRHLMEQQCFYPLYPPPEDFNMEYEMLRKHCTFEKLPHIFITPSDLRHFVKDVEGVCCVNPGRLSRGQSGGTFGRIQIDIEKSATDQIAAQILRI